MMAVLFLLVLINTGVLLYLMYGPFVVVFQPNYQQQDGTFSVSPADLAKRQVEQIVAEARSQMSGEARQYRRDQLRQAFEANQIFDPMNPAEFE